MQEQNAEDYQDRANSVYRCLSDAYQNMQEITGFTAEQIQADPTAYGTQLRMNVDYLQRALRDLDVVDQHGRELYAQDGLTAQDRNTARLMASTIQTLKKNIKETSDGLQHVLSNRQLRERWNNSWLARPRLLGQLFVKSLMSTTVGIPDTVRIQDALQQEQSFVEQVRQLGNILGNREYQIPEGQPEEDDAARVGNRQTIEFFTGKQLSDRTSDVISRARKGLHIQTFVQRRAKKIVPEETAATLRNIPYAGRIVNTVIPAAVEDNTHTDAMINTGNPNAQLHALADNLRGSYNPLGFQDIDRTITYVLGDDLVGHKKNLMRLIKYSPLRPTNTFSLLSCILIPSLSRVEAVLHRAAIDPSAPYIERVQQENNVNHDLSLFGRFSRYFRQKTAFFTRGILEDAGAAIPAIGSARATYLFDTLADDAQVRPSLLSSWITKLKYKSSLCARYIMRKILGEDAVNSLQTGCHGVPISTLAKNAQRLMDQPIVRNLMNDHNGDLKAYARWYLRSRDKQAVQPLHDATITHDGLGQFAVQLGGLHQSPEEAALECLEPLFADI